MHDESWIKRHIGFICKKGYLFMFLLLYIYIYIYQTKIHTSILGFVKLQSRGKEWIQLRTKKNESCSVPQKFPNPWYCLFKLQRISHLHPRSTGRVYNGLPARKMHMYVRLGTFEAWLERHPNWCVHVFKTSLIYCDMWFVNAGKLYDTIFYYS